MTEKDLELEKLLSVVDIQYKNIIKGIQCTPNMIAQNDAKVLIKLLDNFARDRLKELGIIKDLIKTLAN